MPYKLNKIMLALLFGAASTLPAHSYAQTGAQADSQAKSQAATATSSQQQQINFTVTAGTLDQVLNNFAQQAGISLAINGQLTSGKKSNGLQGQYSITQGLGELLIKTELTAKLEKSGSYVLVEKSVDGSKNIATLATAVVQADNIKDGSAEDGYISDGNTNIGMWQERKLQNTPYAISVVSNDLIQNLQATSTDQIFKINPVTRFYRSQAANDTPEIYLRGFRSGSSARNGLVRANYDHGVSMADVERVEILTGMSGFLYGTGNVGGMVNYVSKRPTTERYNSVTLGNTSGSNIYLHGDFGGQVDDDGDFGYRINLLTQDGETAVEHQDAERNFASIALDWQATDSLLLQVDVSHRDYQANGTSAMWSVADGAARPDAKDIDADKLWSQKWTYQETKTDRFGASFHWDINNNLTLRGAYLDENIDRHATFARNSLNGDGSYDQTTRTNQNAPHNMGLKSMFTFLDIDFATGNIEHKVTTGVRYSENTQARFDDGFSQRHLEQNLPLSQPNYIDEPIWDEHGTTPYFLWKWSDTNFTLGDDITFNEHWSALIGATYTQSEDKSYYGGVIDPEETYQEGEVTPSISVIYKPLSSVTIYTSYMEALEFDGIVWDDEYKDKPVINYLERLDLLTSHQIELGTKVDIGGILLTAALFEIDKSLSYYQLINNGEQAKYVQDGRQVHRGLEFTATGRLTDNLTLVGGFTLLDAQIEKQKETPELEGNTPNSVSEEMFKIYAEYEVSAVSGLSLNASFNYTSSFYSDIENTEKLDGFSLVDIGARYQLDIANQSVTLRLNVNNLTDESYWVNDFSLGDGRRVALSANVSF